MDYGQGYLYFLQLWMLNFNVFMKLSFITINQNLACLEPNKIMVYDYIFTNIYIFI